MSRRWTKRPQNHCRSCGNFWYPRGKSRSDRCPRCGSEAVELGLEGCIRAIIFLIASPFLLVWFVVQTAAYLFFFIANIVAMAVSWLIQTTFRLAVGGTIAGGTAAHWSARKAAPASNWLLEQARPLLAKSGRLLLELGHRLVLGILYTSKWVASAKEDVLDDEDREVNPITLLSKLLTFVVLVGIFAILVLKLLRWVSNL